MTTATQTDAGRRSRLDIRLEQLSALLAVTHGAGGESFRRYADEIQDNYLSMCRDIAEECRDLAQSVDATYPAQAAAA